jgi:tRNA-uridine 2-sulfurtransferase
VIGEHKGVWFYTIGQRHGFRIHSKSQTLNLKMKRAIPPLYVVSKDVVRNRLIVGFGPETYQDHFSVSGAHWINGFAGSGEVEVRIRHGGELIPAKCKVARAKGKVELKEPQRGVTPGQSAVFYRNTECLGGGIIL